jgi:hypothetical protein
MSAIWSEGFSYPNGVLLAVSLESVGKGKYRYTMVPNG